MSNIKATEQKMNKLLKDDNISKNNSKKNTASNKQPAKQMAGNKGNQSEHFNYYIIPILIILCILPLIVRLKVYNPGLSQYPWFPDTTSYGDFFLYYKQWLLVGIAAVMAIIIAIKAYLDKKALKFLPVFVPLAIYACFALLSAAFSEHRNFSFLGGFEQFESVFALLSYCLVVYYVFLFVQSEKDLKMIILFFMIGILLMGILGLFQFLGHDFFASKLGLKIMIPDQYSANNKDIIFQNTDNRVYMSLYNPNYVGSYTALVIPLFLALLMFKRKIHFILFYLIAIAGMVVAIIGSKSLTGVFGLAAAILMLAIFMWRHLLKRFYISIPLIIALVVFASFINKQTDGSIVNRILSLKSIQKSEHTLTSLETRDDCIDIIYNGNEMKVTYSIDENYVSNFTPTDSNGEIIPFTVDVNTGTIISADERFPGISLGPDKQYYGVFVINIDGINYSFTNKTVDGTYSYFTRTGKVDKIINAPSSIFTGYETIASGRGYLWSRTLPILKKYIVLGAGPDNFVTAFPQQDYLNILQSGFYDGTITKPHNMYLQIAVQTGIVSLIAFLVFYLIYFISSIRLYIKGKFKNYYAQVGLAIFLGTVAYMVTGLANDSSITTAPIFWTMMGLGILANYKAKPIILAEMEVYRNQKTERKNKITV